MRRHLVSHFRRLAAATGVLLAFVALLAPVPARACRYSVRDTGFVDLDQPPWLLRLDHLPDATRDLWRQSARSRFLDANLRLANDPAEGAVDDARPNPALTLLAPDDRTLPLAAGAEVPTSAPAIAEFLDRLAISPARDELHEQLLRSYAVLFLVEGTDAAGNATARRTAEEAIRAFLPLLGSLPKPVETPPRLVTLPVDRQAAERVLVWSLGLAPEPAAEARLVVLFGRGRRLGPPLEGPLITRTAVGERLSIIGQDCECDLDRTWLRGAVFPARWDVARQTAAARLLSFDPENPLVRTEVTRIVLRGPAEGQGRRAATSAFDTLSLGYREESVDAASPAEANSDSLTNSAGTGPGATPTATASVPPRNPPAPAAPEAPASPTTAPWWVLGGVGGLVLLAGGLLGLKALRAR